MGHKKRHSCGSHMGIRTSSGWLDQLLQPVSLPCWLPLWLPPELFAESALSCPPPDMFHLLSTAHEACYFQTGTSGSDGSGSTGVGSGSAGSGLTPSIMAVSLGRAIGGCVDVHLVVTF
jgi:hypothetical protein